MFSIEEAKVWGEKIKPLAIDLLMVARDYINRSGASFEHAPDAQQNPDGTTGAHLGKGDNRPTVFGRDQMRARIDEALRLMGYDPPAVAAPATIPAPAEAVDLTKLTPEQVESLKKQLGL